MNNLDDLITNSQKIVIIQADNPDGDSLSSALALEAMLSDMGKELYMYCGVEIPVYLRHFQGWDRIMQNLPSNFDLSIIVDTSSVTLLETMTKNKEINWLKTKPCLVIDHHSTEANIDFASIIINQPAVSTGEIIYNIAKQNNWPMPADASSFIACSILYDTLGLTSESVTAEALIIMAELVKNGVSLAQIEDNRRKANKKSLRITQYKGELLKRVELDDSGQIAMITIPWEEIEKYSYEYNPSVLVLDEMRMIEGVKLAVAFKTYPDGKITAKIRANLGFNIADKLAENFGGGGHPYASGFKILDKKDFQSVKNDTINKAKELLKYLQ